LSKEGHWLRHPNLEMPMWVWIVIGLGLYLCLSLLAAFGLAAILEMIGRQISELHETDDWAMLPPTRASHEVSERHPDEVEPKSSRVDRLSLANRQESEAVLPRFWPEQ
jgi:hypothetical protein